jgi:hypothetical protein
MAKVDLEFWSVGGRLPEGTSQILRDLSRSEAITVTAVNAVSTLSVAAGEENVGCWRITAYGGPVYGALGATPVATVALDRFRIGADQTIEIAAGAVGQKLAFVDAPAS